MSTLRQIGHDLSRPECVLAHSSGLIFTSNWAGNGGVSIICANGKTHSVLGKALKKPVKPNGIALEPNGNFLLAHLGDTTGGVFRLKPDNSVSEVITHANGTLLPPTNFVTIDAIGRIWLTVSTIVKPRTEDYRSDACTGFIAVAEHGQTDARIVVNDLGYANECVIDMNNNYVYVNETFGRKVTRFDLAADGSLSNRHNVTSFSAGNYPDGLTLAEDGNLIVTSIVSNRIIKVAPNGKQLLLLEDADIDFVEGAETAFQSNTLGREHLATTGKTKLTNTSSLAFGGVDRSTAYLGSLQGDCLYSFDTAMRGVAPSHWNVSLGHLENFLND